MYRIEHAVTKMTKQETAQLQLKSKATTGVEKFNIPSHTAVQYEVTLINFEKVCPNQLINTTQFKNFFLL